MIPPPRDSTACRRSGAENQISGVVHLENLTEGICVLVSEMRLTKDKRERWVIVDAECLEKSAYAIIFHGRTRLSGSKINRISPSVRCFGDRVAAIAELSCIN